MRLAATAAADVGGLETVVGRQEPGGKDRKGGRSGGGKKEGIVTHQSDLSTRPVALVLALTSDNFMFGSGVPEIVKKP